MKKIEELNSFDEFAHQILHDFVSSMKPDHESANNESLIWIDCLSIPKVRTVLTQLLNIYKGSSAELSRDILENISNKISSNQKDISKILIFSSISALQLYTVDNFLCFINPSDDFTEYRECLQFIENIFLITQEANAQFSNHSLNVDGEKLHSVARNSVLLKLARLIFTVLKELPQTDNDLEYFHLLIWSLRSVVVHQMSLKSVTNTLFQEILFYIDRIVPFIEIIEEKSEFFFETINPQLRLDILNEVLSAVLIYGEVEHSKRYFLLTQNISKLKFNLTGRLGTRTLYQSKPLPQLMVHLEKGHTNNPTETTFKSNLPKNEKLEDDTLLQGVKFVSTNESGQNVSGDEFKLTESEQCYLIATIKYTKRFGSFSDNLLREELLTYVYFLLEKVTVWSVCFNLLELRSLLERNDRRRIERSMKQFETLTNTVRSTYERRFLLGEIQTRIRYFYAVLPSPYWTVEKHLADLLISLGVVKSALDIYLRLELWDNVIDCYRQIGRPHKAEEIVRKKLEEGGDDQPELHCLLGEITGDVECYHHAWKVSGQRFARAPKMLGMHYFGLKEYERALEFFEQSVAINSMQLDVWYRIGFISLQHENWEMAVSAYRRVLQFDEESFEPWNNLSKAYIKLNKKDVALHTLQEAIKLNFEEWKLWDNYIAVAVDVGDFNETIEAWNRLIDLKGKYIDDMIGDILAKAIIEDRIDCYQQPASRYLPKALKLFGRVTATCDGSASLWLQYAKLLIKNREAETSRITQCLQKSHRKMLSIAGWDKDFQKVTDMVQHWHELADKYLTVADMDPTNLATNLNGCRLSLNSVLVQINRAKDDLALIKVNESKMPELESKIGQLEQKLDTVKQRLAS